MSGSLEILTLPFVRVALGSGLLIAAMCSYLGVFVVLRRIVFVGIALAQLAAVGVALSFYIPLPCEVLALISALVGALLLGSRWGGRYLPREAGVGFAYAAASAAAILLVAKSAQGEAHVLGILFGDILTLQMTEVGILIGVTAFVLLLHAVFYKQFVFTSFDPESARAAGIRVGVWTALFDLTLAAAIAIAIHAAGALLVFSYLVQPAMVGLILAERMRWVLALAVGSGLLATVVGLLLSILMDLPTGPTVVAFSSGLVVLALIVQRMRRDR